MAFKKFKRFLNACFTGRDGQRFAYYPWQFPTGGSGPLELAYALTVHKAQGSDFGIVFVVVPQQTRLMSRELLYTALTRSRRRLVLLIEGSDASFLYDLTRPEKSETARRNTNLFSPGIRDDADRAVAARRVCTRPVAHTGCPVHTPAAGRRHEPISTSSSWFSRQDEAAKPARYSARRGACRQRGESSETGPESTLLK